jgi:hypothetical protein
VSIVSEQRQQILAWIRDNGILALTASGIAAYVILTLPATVFYRRLGTTPDEVGITYTTLLGGSTPAMLLLATCLAAVFFALAAVLAILGLYLRTAPLMVRMFRVITSGPARSTDDEKFEARISLLKDLYTKIPELADIRPGSPEEDIQKLRQARELALLGVRTEDQSKLQDQLAISTDMPLDRFWTAVTNRVIQRWGRPLGVFSFAVVAFVLLPLSAYLQAGMVAQGKVDIVSDLGLVSYRAHPVTISPATLPAKDFVQPFSGQRLFLLGQNSEFVVLYAPASQATIRLPVASVIVSGTH